MKRNFFKLYWDKNVGKARRVTHISELNLQTFISIKEQLRTLVRKYPGYPEKAAREIADEYGLDFNEIFHMAFNFVNRVDLFD